MTARSHGEKIDNAIRSLHGTHDAIGDGITRATARLQEAYGAGSSADATAHQTEAASSSLAALLYYWVLLHCPNRSF